jgi:CO/xanthine dehydrogenase FAD-binding subunit
MKPASFEYLAPESLEQALGLLAECGDTAKVLAGGQSLVPMMNFRLVSPAVIVDLNRVSELAFVRAKDETLAIGAMTRQRQLERDPLVKKMAPLVAETMPFVAHPQIRNRGTVGGIFAHADPAAELPAVAVALDAQLKLSSSKGERWVSAKDFFLGLFATALEPTELLTEIVLRTSRPRTGYSFQEMSRRHGDYALVGVASTVTLDEKGECQDARVVLLGVGMLPIEARQSAEHMIGAAPSGALIEAAAQAVDADIDPTDDIHASAAYRRHLARVLVRRALETACVKAGEEAA